MKEPENGSRTASDPPAILIVDDTVANLLAFSAILKKVGCRIMTASSGPEALRLTQSQDFAVILLDIRMPEWNGFETAQRLRQSELRRRTPIIFMSAIEAPPMHLLQGFVGSEVDFLPSPVDTELLVRKVSAYLRTSSAEEPADPSDPRLAKAGFSSDEILPGGDPGGRAPRPFPSEGT